MITLCGIFIVNIKLSVCEKPRKKSNPEKNIYYRFWGFHAYLLINNLQTFDKNEGGLETN